MKVTFEDLPNDVLSVIILHLTASEVMRTVLTSVGHVNQSFRRLVFSSSYWTAEQLVKLKSIDFITHILRRLRPPGLVQSLLIPPPREGQPLSLSAVLPLPPLLPNLHALHVPLCANEVLQLFLTSKLPLTSFTCASLSSDFPYALSKFALTSLSILHCKWDNERRNICVRLKKENTNFEPFSLEQWNTASSGLEQSSALALLKQVPNLQELSLSVRSAESPTVPDFLNQLAVSCPRLTFLWILEDYKSPVHTANQDHSPMGFHALQQMTNLRSLVLFACLDWAMPMITPLRYVQHWNLLYVYPHKQYLPQVYPLAQFEDCAMVSFVATRCYFFRISFVRCYELQELSLLHAFAYRPGTEWQCIDCPRLQKVCVRSEMDGDFEREAAYVKCQPDLLGSFLHLSDLFVSHISLGMAKSLHNLVHLGFEFPVSIAEPACPFRYVPWDMIESLPSAPTLKSLEILYPCIALSVDAIFNLPEVTRLVLSLPPDPSCRPRWRHPAVKSLTFNCPRLSVLELKHWQFKDVDLDLTACTGLQALKISASHFKFKGTGNEWLIRQLSRNPFLQQPRFIAVLESLLPRNDLDVLLSGMQLEEQVYEELVVH